MADFTDHAAPDSTHLDKVIDFESALRQIPPRFQAVLALRADGYTQADAAGILEIARTNVWSDEKAAKELIRNIIG